MAVLGGAIDSNYHGGMELLLHSGGKKEHAWNAETPLGSSSVLPRPVIKATRKPQCSPGQLTKDPDSSGMKVWVTPSGKEPRPIEGGGNTELIVEV